MSETLSLDDLLSGVETTTSSDASALPRACRLAVFGSRSLADERVFALIRRYALELEAALIVTAAEPAGVCQVAQEYARRTKTPLQVHFLQNEKYARGMWHKRSEKVIEASDIVLLIHDGASRGTHNEMLQTIGANKPYIYERIPVEAAHE